VIWYEHNYLTTIVTTISFIAVFAEGPRDALSVEILSNAAQLYEKSHLKTPAKGE